MSAKLVTEWNTKADDYDRMAKHSYKSECHGLQRAGLLRGALVLRMCAKQLQESMATKPVEVPSVAQDRQAESAATARQVRPRTQRRQAVAEVSKQPEATIWHDTPEPEQADQGSGPVEVSDVRQGDD